MKRRGGVIADIGIDGDQSDGRIYDSFVLFFGTTEGEGEASPLLFIQDWKQTTCLSCLDGVLFCNKRGACFLLLTQVIS